MACQPNDCVREASFEHAMALNSRSAYFARSKIAPQQAMQDFGHVSMEAAVGRCCRRAGIEEGGSQGRLGLPPSGGGVVQATTTLRPGDPGDPAVGANRRPTQQPRDWRVIESIGICASHPLDSSARRRETACSGHP